MSNDPNNKAEEEEEKHSVKCWIPCNVHVYTSVCPSAGLKVPSKRERTSFMTFCVTLDHFTHDF